MHTGPMMKISSYTSAAALTLMLAGCAAPPMAPAAAPAPASAGVASTASVAEADAKLADVAQRRQVAEALYAASESECYTRFFVSRCLDKAREQRRATLAGLHAIEVEASHFKRVESVERRDAALAERQKQDERDAAARAALPLKTPHVLRAEPEAAPAKAESIEKRVAGREANEQRRKAQEAAGAGARAAHAAAFKRKQQEATARQRAVAEKQAAKADKAAKDAQAVKDAPAAPQPEAAGK